MNTTKLVWSIEIIDLKLKYDWKISRNTSRFKQNLVVKINGVPVGEAAPNIRWGETVDQLTLEFKKIESKLPGSIEEICKFRTELRSFNICQSLKCALDMAILSFTEKKQLFGGCQTSYSIPILNIGEYEDFFNNQNLFRFDSIKVKLDSNLVMERLSEIRSFYSGRLFVDFNEAFSSLDQFKLIIDELNKAQIEVVEQPFCSKNLEHNRSVKKILEGSLFLDENIIDERITVDLLDFCDGVNIKIQKTGGPTRAQEMLDQASKIGLKKMVGCMVETSLGISQSMRLSGVDYYDLDGSLMIENEPFGLLKEEDGTLVIVDSKI